MNNNNYKKCTGNNVRIILLDSGLPNEGKMINYDGKTIDDISFFASNDHCVSCLSAAKSSASNAEFVTINVGDLETGVITESNVLSGLELALSLAPRIIVMCFSFEKVTNKFKETINDVLSKGIFLCASVDPIVKNSFPQSLPGVISVDEYVNNSDNREIFIYNGTFYVPSSNYASIKMSGSSIATAYFSGVIARLLEFSPMITSESLKEYFEKEQDKCTYVDESNAYYLISGQHDISTLDISSNYLYFFDDVARIFKDKSGKFVEWEKIKMVDIICGDDYIVKRPTVTEFIQHNVPFRYFDNFTTDYKYLNDESISLKSISIPSICICSYETNMDKLYIQTSLCQQIKRNGYRTGIVSFNPIMKLSNSTFIPFPQNIMYPSYFYYLNNQIYEESTNKELLIISAAGSFERFVGFEHRLGDTSNIIFSACNPDIVILCVADFISLSELEKAKLYVENVIGAKVIFFISNNSRDDNYYGPSDYNLKLSDDVVKSLQKSLQHQLKRKVFTKAELGKGLIAEYILKCL